jgi:formyltetrahydrofolate synthetase
MSILGLTTGMQDLRERLNRIVVGRSPSGDYVTAEEIGAAGAMAALLKNAIRPNLVQTSEHTPAIVHSGPFANISHGNSSVIADLTALRLAEFVVTESGFGSELGAEKFFDLKCRPGGLHPNAMVLVCTVRSLKYHSGRFRVRPGRPLPDAMLQEDLAALRAGVSNLEGHLANLQQFGVPVIAAINQFPTDTQAELQLVGSLARDAGADQVARVDAFARGSAGCLELADLVVDACRQSGEFQPLYPLTASLQEKIGAIATKSYGADGVDYGEGVETRLNAFAARGFGELPVCIAKTQYSLSHDPKLLGRPVGYRLPIRDVKLSAGAGFVLAMTEGISLMPGLPRDPAAKKIDLDANGVIHGLGN